MKTLVLSMISIAATVAAMTACTSESDPINDITNPKDAKVEIKLNAGVVNVETKAQIVPKPITGTTFSEATQVPLLRLEGATSPTWSTATNPTNATITGSNVVLDDSQKFYPAESDTKVYFIGYYPSTGSYTSGIVSYTGIVGETDILCTPETCVGSKHEPASSPSLQFNHMLSQVEIKLKGDVAAQNAFGKIKKIELVNIPTSLDLTLGSTIAIVAKNDSPIQNIAVYDNATGTNLTTTATTIGETAMIYNGGSQKYGTSANSLEIKITYGDTNTTSIVNVNNMTTGLETGKKHVITLSFKEKIEVSSAITEWDTSTGESGNGEVG
ncbi:fimbrillin family protein [Parabacteroides goldsteinii]|jgi:hypothetical protein